MGENFCLKWNDYDRNLSSTFCQIREEEELLDITLACEDTKQLQAHKVILSACSPFFRSILKRNPHDHPLLYLRGVRYRELEAILHFIYNGEVNVGQDELNEFLLVAEDLKIKGLTQSQNSPESQHYHRKQQQETKPINNNIQSSNTTSTNITTTTTSKRACSNDNNTILVPGLKRARLITPPTTDKIESYDTDEVHVPSALVVGSNHRESDDLTEESIGTGGDVFDESSIIEENYDGEDGEYVGGVEEYEQNEITEVNFGGGGSGGGGQENTSSGANNTRGYVQCPICAKLMYRKNLSRHVAVKHSNVQPVRCTMCDKTMKNGWSLKEHERKYHGLFQADKVLLMQNSS